VARGRAAAGIDCEFAVRIPEDHILAEPVRLASLAPRVGAPIDGAALDDYFVTRAEHDADGDLLRLQETPRPDARGFDVVLSAVRGAAPAVHRIGEGVQLLIAPDRAPDLDAAWTRVDAALRSLIEHREAIAGATLGGEPLAHLERPQQLAEVLISSIGPLVGELSERSRVPGELTLKRERGGGQRDELFIPQAQLLSKLRSLSPEHRALFGAYGLEGSSDLITAQVRRLELPLRASPNHDV
jgi:hypothetical protein